jgi:hypothetical protein
MFHKIFYNENHDVNPEYYEYIKDSYVKVIVGEKENPYMFDMFIDNITSHNPLHIQVVEDNLNLQLEDDNDIINEAEDTVTMIKKYIGNLNLENTKPVEDLFYSLYNDALELE